MREYIGVLGGNGSVGKNVVLTLQRLIDDKIILATTRKNNNGINDENTRYEYLDISDNKQLETFCVKCSTIINCVGPSSIIKNKIAKTCLNTKTNYIEVSGEYSLCNEIKALNKHFYESKINCVYSAGVNPGLVEALTSFYLAKYNESKTIEVYFTGAGDFSCSSAIDMVESCRAPDNAGMSFLENGEIKKINHFEQTKELPQPFGRMFCIPVINDHFAKCIKEQKIQRAFFYNAFKTTNIISIMFEARNSNSDMTIKNIANRLCESFKKERLLYKQEFTALYFKIYGENLVAKRIVYNGNWNQLTGIIAAIVAVGVEQGEIIRYGVGAIWDSLNMEWFYKKIVEIKEMVIDL